MVFAGYGIVAKELGRRRLREARREEEDRRRAPLRARGREAREHRGAAPLRRHPPQGLQRAREGRGGARSWSTTRRRPRARSRLEGARRGEAPAAAARGLLGRGAARRRAQARASASRSSSASPKKRKVPAKLDVALSPVARRARSTWSGASIAEPGTARSSPASIVVGAHYDHLGKGGRDSLAPHSDEPHLGADDNASGAAVLLEVARELARRKSRAQARRRVRRLLRRGDGRARLGAPRPRVDRRRRSRRAKLEDVVAMLNMDMVGRMRDNRLQVLGTETARRVEGPRAAACDKARVECAASGDGYGPSDQTSFYAGGRAGAALLHRRARRLPQALRHRGQDQRRRRGADGQDLRERRASRASQRDTPLTFKAGIEGPAPPRRPAQLQRLARDDARLRRPRRGQEGRAARGRAPGRRRGQGRA